MLLLVIEALHGVWLVEQPSSSLLFDSDRFRWLLSHLADLGMRVPSMNLRQTCVIETCWLEAVNQVFCQRFHMKFFGHPTAKLTVVFANTPQILGFKHPPMKKHELTCEVKTTIKRVRKSDGKASYQGSPHLKGTQLPGSSSKDKIDNRQHAHFRIGSSGHPRVYPAKFAIKCLEIQQYALDDCRDEVAGVPWMHEAHELKHMG